MYGPYTNEELIGKALVGNRDAVFLATKFGINRDPVTKAMINDGSPKNMQRAIDGSLAPRTPIEETVGAMAELVKSRQDPSSRALRDECRHDSARACRASDRCGSKRVFALLAAISKRRAYSRRCENSVSRLWRTVPLGRGLLSGTIRSVADLEPEDDRHRHPRWQGEKLRKHLEPADRIGERAREIGATPAQVAIAWVLAQGGDILTIEAAAPRDVVTGARYADMSQVNR